jgi:hypothetical protein
MAEEPIARTWRGRVFIGVSLDGYIARPDSDIEWLTDPPSHIEHERVVSDVPRSTGARSSPTSITL